MVFLRRPRPAYAGHGHAGAWCMLMIGLRRVRAVLARDFTGNRVYNASGGETLGYRWMVERSCACYRRVGIPVLRCPIA